MVIKMNEEIRMHEKIAMATPEPGRRTVSEERNPLNIRACVSREESQKKSQILERCEDKSFTDTSKRTQLFKMLCLTLVPILSLWGFTMFTLTDTINKKTENEKTRKEVQLSVELGNLIHRLQQERDTSVLYLSALGPETKTFLLQEYIGTDNAIDALSEWPADLDIDNRDAFKSRDSLRDYLVRHRQLLTKVKYNLQMEIDFYTNIIRVVIAWLYESITRGKDAEVWKTLVAYLKLTSGKQDVGIERALGTLFYVQGGFETGFESQNYYNLYNTVIHTSRAFYETAELYSNRIVRLYTTGVSEAGSDLIAIINGFRYEIQHYEQKIFHPDIQKARYWFDNMTLYMDALLKIQQNLGFEIIGRLDVVIDNSTRDLSISAACLVTVLIMCPLVIFVANNLTSSIQRNAVVLAATTTNLLNEQAETNILIYQSVPKGLIKRRGDNWMKSDQYLKSVTVMFTDIYDFLSIASVSTPANAAELLSNLNQGIEDLLQNANAMYKVKAFNDNFMIASGIENDDDKHMTKVAKLSLDLLHMMHSKQFNVPDFGQAQIRIGINTGPVMIGITGNTVPQLCVMGEMVQNAIRMKDLCEPNHIHITHPSFNALQADNVFMTQRRTRSHGPGSGKGKGKMKTYWLYGRKDGYEFTCKEIEEGNKWPKQTLPGELTQYDSDCYKATYKVPLPGLRTKNGGHDQRRSTASGK